jgi:hypothetical protein
MADILITPASSLMSFTSSLNYTQTLTQEASGSLTLLGSGSTGRTDLFTVNGNNGTLFSVSDDLSNSLFSVNTIAGLPVIEAFANNTVVMGQYGQNVLVVTGSNVGIGTATPSQKLHIVGTGFASSDFRAPIFYDSDDTNYYLNPTSNTSIRTVGSWRADSSAWDGEFSGKMQYHANQWYIQGADNLIYRNANGVNVFSVNQLGSATATSDYRAPIFYDSDNTSYYGDFAGTSNLYGLTVNQTISGNISGNATTATNLSTNRTNWNTNGTITAVVGQLAWKNYGNNHTIFDASNSTTPGGGATSNTNPDVAWSSTYPTLMGWNGSSTYGVRVDSARTADSTSAVSGTTNYVAKFTSGTAIGNSLIYDNGTSVGIGTTTLYGRFSVSSGNFDGIRVDTNSGYNAISIGGTGAFSIDAPGVGSGRFVVTNSGNVGIGTTSPGYKLDVNGDGRFIFRNNSNEIMDLLLSTEGAASKSKLSLLWYGNETAALKFSRGANSTGGSMEFWTQPEFGSTTQRMTIASSGNVGIGTANPAALLHVSQPSANTVFRLGNNTTYDQFIYFNGNNDWSLGMDYSNSNAFVLSNSSTIGTNDRVVVTTAGNVGIGTTSPSQLLEVNGRALVNQFQYTKAINYSSGDLDSLTLAGFYDGSGMTNAPNSGWFYVTVEKHSDGSTSWVHQTATSFGAGNTGNEVYTRVRVGTTWGSWKQLGDAASISGTTNYVAKFTSGTAIGNSLIYDNGTNVGIGTASPGAKLDVNGDIYANGDIRSQGVFRDYQGEALLQTTTSAITQLGSTGAGTSRQLAFLAGNAERMRITTSGDVGIGTTSPATKLHVQGSNLMTTFRNSDTGANQYTQLEFIAGSRDAYIWLGNQNTTQWAGDGGLNIYTGTGNIDFWTAASQKVRITSGGNVGIGTTSPAELVEAYKSFNGDVAYQISNPNAGASATAQFFASNGTTRTQFFHTGTSYNGTGILASSAGLGGIYNNTSQGIALLASSAAGVIKFGTTTSNTERMRITSAGNVGIGTSSPSQLLHVAGTAYASSDFRAPIFYDSDNTNYYLDPNNVSLLDVVRPNYIQNPASITSDTNFGIYFNSSVDSAYGIFRESGGWSHPYPDLRIAFHTGIKMGAASSYNGMRFYNDYDMASQVMSINNGSDPLGGGNVYVNNSLQAGSSLRAPIFYDSDDTSYYGDFAGTSNLNDLQIQGDIKMQGSDSYIWMPNNNSLSTGFYDPVTSLAPIKIEGPSDGIYIGNTMWISYNTNNTNDYNENIRLFPSSNGVSVIAFRASGTGGTPSNSLLGYSSYFEIRQGGQWQLRSYADYIEAYGSFRAPIFYDSQDTGYYLDLNSTSNLNQLTTNTRARWNMPRWWTDRTINTADQNYWTGTNGWGTGLGTWANAWKGGFSGWDIWGENSDHPQGSGYVHAQGIVSGQHYATTDGSQGYGWMMVGAASATDNRYWLRGKWGGTTSSWVEMITTGNIGSQSVGNADTLDGYHETSFIRIAANSSSPTNANFAIGQSGGRNFIQSHAGQPLDINPLGNTVYINSNVGIGTTSPSEKLHVVGNILGSAKLTIGSGHTNSGTLSSIAGGTGNTASGTYSFVGGGENNGTYGSKSAVVGGDTNGATGECSFIGAGYGNCAGGNQATISGGYGNTAIGANSFIGGGTANFVGNHAVVSGGCCNNASGNYSFIGGGAGHTASGAHSTVGGGAPILVLSTLIGNTASGCASTVAGGQANTASNYHATIGGGYGNTASFSRSTVSGGYQNTASCYAATVVGGLQNTASNSYAFVGAGQCNTASGFLSVVTGGGGFASGNVASGGYSFIGGGSGDFMLGNQCASGQYSSIVGGKANTASGNYSSIGGGYINIAGCAYSVVGGGGLNRAIGNSTIVGGGYNNTASGIYSGILGGSGNATACCYSFIVGTGITADRICSTFVNNLSIKNIPTSSAGLPAGSVWSNGGVLNIV